MKIGIDIRNIGKKRTGDEVVFFNLVKNFSKIDNKNEYNLFTDITNDLVLNNIKLSLGIENKRNFRIISLKTSNKFFWNFWTLPRYLFSNPIDIYLTQYITPFFVSKKVKIATIIHDISFNFYPKFIKFWDLFFLKTLIPLSLKRADKVISVSKFTQEEVLRYYKIDEKKLDWIHNAVSDDFLNKDFTEEKIKKVKEKYSLPEKYILYLGTLQPRKNLPTLIDAYTLLRSEFSVDKKNIKLVLAGGKGYNYDKKIDELIEKNGLAEDVVFPGFIDESDKAYVIKAAEVFCFPSYYEGFGIPILEAMTLGVPVVASNIPPHCEIAKDSVLFFEPNIARDLTEKISQIINNEILRESLKNNAKKQLKNFSWEKTASRTLEIMKNF